MRKRAIPMSQDDARHAGIPERKNLTVVQVAELEIEGASAVRDFMKPPVPSVVV
jgi:hypothetical protein